MCSTFLACQLKDGQIRIWVGRARYDRIKSSVSHAISYHRRWGWSNGTDKRALTTGLLWTYAVKNVDNLFCHHKIVRYVIQGGVCVWGRFSHHESSQSIYKNSSVLVTIYVNRYICRGKLTHLEILGVSHELRRWTICCRIWYIVSSQLSNVIYPVANHNSEESYRSQSVVDSFSDCRIYLLLDAHDTTATSETAVRSCR